MCRIHICNHYYCGHRCTAERFLYHWTWEECDDAKRRKERCAKPFKSMNHNSNVPLDVCDNCKENFRYWIPKGRLKYEWSPDGEWHVKRAKDGITMQMPSGPHLVDHYPWVECLNFQKGTREFSSQEWEALKKGRQAIPNDDDVKRIAAGRPYYNTGGGAYTVPRLGMNEQSVLIDQAYNPPPTSQPDYDQSGGMASSSSPFQASGSGSYESNPPIDNSSLTGHGDIYGADQYFQFDEPQQSSNQSNTGGYLQGSSAFGQGFSQSDSQSNIVSSEQQSTDYQGQGSSALDQGITGAELWNLEHSQYPEEQAAPAASSSSRSSGNQRSRGDQRSSRHKRSSDNQKEKRNARGKKR